MMVAIRQLIADAIFPEGKEQRDRAEREANMDALTGVANRRALERALPTAERDPDVQVILFDANNFGKVNKMAGHLAGDHLLRDLAATIERCAGRFGFGTRVFRAGGDEFVILAPSRMAEALRNAVEAEFGSRQISGFAVSISGTIGKTFESADACLQARKAEAKA